MKIIKKVFIIIIVFILSIPLFNNNVSGDNDIFASYRKGTGYVAIGDSYTRGFGACENWKDEIYLSDTTDEKNCRNVTGSYPSRICEALGLFNPDDITNKDAQYWPLCHSSLTTSYILDLLGVDDGFCDTEFIYNNPTKLGTRYATDLYYFGDTNSYAYGGKEKNTVNGCVKGVTEIISNASLITIGLGGADVWQRPLDLYYKNIDFADVESINTNLSLFIETLFSGLDTWKEAYHKLISYVDDITSDDCTIVLVGVMNPYQDLKLYEGSLISIGNVINMMIDIMNKYYRQIAQEFDCIFIDISNIECPTTEEGLSINDFPRIDIEHPSIEGYSQIAQMIIEALKEKELGKQKTNIKIDIGRFKKVDYVLLNGVKTTNYSLDSEGLLTIQNDSYNLNTLTIAVVESKYKIAVTNYALIYSDGYIIKKIYTTNNIFSPIITIVKTIKSVFNKIFK